MVRRLNCRSQTSKSYKNKRRFQDEPTCSQPSSTTTGNHERKDMTGFSVATTKPNMTTDRAAEIHHNEWAQPLINLEEICDIDKLLQAIRFVNMDRLDESGFDYRIYNCDGNSVYVCVQPGCDPKRIYNNDKSFLYHIHTHHLKSIALFQCPECGEKVAQITRHMAEHEARNLHLANQPLTIKNTLIRSIPGMSDSQVKDFSKSFSTHSSSD